MNRKRNKIINRKGDADDQGRHKTVPVKVTVAGKR